MTTIRSPIKRQTEDLMHIGFKVSFVCGAPVILDVTSLMLALVVTHEATFTLEGHVALQGALKSAHLWFYVKVGMLHFIKVDVGVHCLHKQRQIFVVISNHLLESFTLVFVVLFGTLMQD